MGSYSFINQYAYTSPWTREKTNTFIYISFYIQIMENIHILVFLNKFVYEIKYIYKQICK